MRLCVGDVIWSVLTSSASEINNSDFYNCYSILQSEGPQNVPNPYISEDRNSLVLQDQAES